MFAPASEMQIHKFTISGPIRRMMNEEITEFQRGVNVITASNLKEIHRGLHWTMIDALEQGISVILVDVANMFNPHTLPDIININNRKNIRFCNYNIFYYCIVTLLIFINYHNGVF